MDSVLQRVEEKYLKRIENAKREKTFKWWKMKLLKEFWKVFKFLMIIFNNIYYINSVVLKIMKLIIFKTFFEWKKWKVNKKLISYTLSFKENKIKIYVKFKNSYEKIIDLYYVVKNYIFNLFLKTIIYFVKLIIIFCL